MYIINEGGMVILPLRAPVRYRPPMEIGSLGFSLLGRMRLVYFTFKAKSLEKSIWRVQQPLWIFRPLEL